MPQTKGPGTPGNPPESTGTPSTTTAAAKPSQPDTAPARASAEQPAPSVPATTEANPATKAVTDAVRKAELRQLTEERDALREKLGDAPELAVLRAEVDALRQVAARAGVTIGRERMSAGVASDLEAQGHAVDPANGDVYVRDGGKVTLTTRAGEVREVDMPGRSTDKPA
jgi:hypothetical protein